MNCSIFAPFSQSQPLPQKRGIAAGYNQLLPGLQGGLDSSAPLTDQTADAVEVDHRRLSGPEETQGAVAALQLSQTQGGLVDGLAGVDKYPVVHGLAVDHLAGREEGGLPAVVPDGTHN